MRMEVKDMSDSALLLEVEIKPSLIRRFIVGQDSPFAAPFVTQVPRRMETLKDAFSFIMPKDVKKAIEAGLDVKRQGDWFFVPTDTEPKTASFSRDPHPVWHFEKRQVIMMDERQPEPGVLYDHVYRLRETRHRANEVVLRANGRHYVRGTVQAPDHEDLDLGDQWHIAIKRVYMQNGPGMRRVGRLDD